MCYVQMYVSLCDTGKSQYTVLLTDGLCLYLRCIWMNTSMHGMSMSLHPLPPVNARLFWYLSL